MKIISCKGCGVVLDAENVDFPPVWDADGTYIQGNSEWDGDEYISVAKCPVCSYPIRRP